MKASRIGIVALALTCAGCGGSGGNGAAPTSNQQALTHKTQVLIEEYGDSKVEGLQTIDGKLVYTPNSEPVKLQALLQTQFGTRVTVVNKGISGSEASNFLYGGTASFRAITPWAQQMAQSQADIVGISLGTNDALYRYVPTPGMPAETPEQFGSILTQMVQIARANGKKVVLFETMPSAFPDGNAALALYMPQVRALAAAQQVPLVSSWEFAQGLPNYASMLTDGVHPTDSLYALVAQWAAPVYAPIVQAMLN
jgi:lysophospholipase L1-like esterase